MGRAADAWDIPPAVVDDLKSKYREAAECLELGGLLTEAVTLYEQLGLWEKAGDVHAKLDRRDDADRCYRLQVEAHVQHADFVSAAHVLESKLAVPDDALAMLVSVGPTSRSWGTCLRAAFQLMGRLGRHEQAGIFVRKLRENRAPSGSETILADSLAAVSKQYPDSRIRLLSADATRVLCGTALSDPEFSDRAAMARCVATLNPEDRLLSRDANRFLNRPSARPQLKQRVRSGHDPVVLRQFSLPDQIVWRAGILDPDVQSDPRDPA
ncbi:MAG TPA: hypothetical protein VN541_07845 [Tepidisphaeraceae bacterium]|nr:hypothetical protein [Tepidisphaeraceae bacterium]